MSTPLSILEIRVLASLIEKKLATPDYYPMTANSLLAACNQKSNRNPVMNLEAQDLEAGLETLRARQLVSAMSGGGMRTLKYVERFSERLSLNVVEQAVLAVLMLRGDQTPGEIRSRSARMAESASIDELHQVLDRLSVQDPPLLFQLDRRPGQSERRWRQLLGGSSRDAVETDASTPDEPAPSPLADPLTRLEDQIQELKTELEELKTQFRQFQSQFE